MGVDRMKRRIPVACPPSIEGMKILVKIRPKYLISRHLIWLLRGMLKGTDYSMQKVISPARPHHSCVPCQGLSRKDSHAKRKVKLKTIIFVSRKPMKPMSRAQKDQNEVERTNRSCA